MEVREIVKLVDPDSGRIISVHVTEAELNEIVQVGLFTMLQLGHISFKAMADAQTAIDIPEGVSVN